MSLETKAEKCDLCGGTENVKGPYAGGPFPFICERCLEITHKYVKGHKELRAFFKEKIDNRIGELEDRLERIRKLEKKQFPEEREDCYFGNYFWADEIKKWREKLRKEVDAK